MENPFLQHIQGKVSDWRGDGYRGVERETLNILNQINRVGFLHKPQIEALETYIYLKEIVGNKPSVEIFQSLFDNEKDMVLGLGVSKDEAFDLIGNKEKIDSLMVERFGSTDYPNQVYALTMGSGKTILMAVMMIYDFVLSFYHPDDNRFAKNALVFAPDTTIIESLKEIKSFDYSKVLPKEYQNILLNLKYHYLESVDTPLSPIGNYNVIVSNSQKIILKTSRIKNDIQQGLFADMKYLAARDVENKRLLAIREIKNLAVFVDEAHHSYGQTLEGTLKKTRHTINYIHGKSPLVGVINLTGTPYINNRMISDVVYHFGLKQGIEGGILKQVRFFDYSNVRTDSFIEDVVDKFWSEYSENRLEEKLPKIAFYAASIDDLRQELRPTLERYLSRKGISLDKILEYHTEAEDSRDEFFALDSPDSQKQFVLLVGKGTEGWNCRSLVACALFRKPKSSIFVLQSTTRCLRSIGDNSTIATIFLSDENYRVLDKELKNNFATSLEELSAQDQHVVEHTVKVVKRKKIMVKKVLKEILSVQSRETINIEWSKFNPEKYASLVSEGGIFLHDKKAHYRGFVTHSQIQTSGNLTYYELVELVNRKTHLPCLAIERILNDFGKKADLVEKVNANLSLIPFIVESVLANAYEYQESVETLEEEVELTKLYPFKIIVEQGRSTLIVYKEQFEEALGQSRIGFHVNPYSFDSSDEKNLFKYLYEVLADDETVVDVYFTGGAPDPSHNEFYFEYYSPEKQQLARYFPDFLIETSSGRYLVIEVKSTREKTTYEQNKKDYRGQVDGLFDEVFAKEIGFREFQKVNQNFEYKIIFDASLQQEQRELVESVEGVNKC
jgi:hypothetical protein